ncbi:Transposase InsO and inactivated derivatives [Paenibacillus uliginis N3/975]|uniref:Transposase InsO and inactivated derivatives n=1 Tax=Paenibacillus uliginis N3/975 TaxID=1313296 RepID=A0A1X7HGP2_9BACL|nr:IS3 family transposase [Paenibacillus uliginis]SMF86424.1 Transposase InsO and inactivated derivatives [Paenibacillus uliginis N3/975]
MDLYQAIQELHAEKGYALTKLCEIAGIARSAYYKWLKWKPSTRELEILSLAKEVKLRYDKRKGVLGYRQIRTQLNRKLKRNYNKKRYYRIMRALGLKSVIRKKRPNYVRASEIHVAENVMNREFQADAPNMKWCTDVTELKYGNGRKAYLSAIVDVYDNSIVSWVLSHSNNNKLVMDTVKKAYGRNPGVTPLLHSDRGFQYTSHEYSRLQVKYGFTKSMSRVSRCLDNQPIERFWGTLKAESFYLTKHDTYDDVLEDVRNYIRYYNNYRYTERLNGLSPNEYRRAA